MNRLNTILTLTIVLAVRLSAEEKTHEQHLRELGELRVQIIEKERTIEIARNPNMGAMHDDLKTYERQLNVLQLKYSTLMLDYNIFSDAEVENFRKAVGIVTQAEGAKLAAEAVKKQPAQAAPGLDNEDMKAVKESRLRRARSAFYTAKAAATRQIGDLRHTSRAIADLQSLLIFLDLGNDGLPAADLAEIAATKIKTTADIATQKAKLQKITQGLPPLLKAVTQAKSAILQIDATQNVDDKYEWSPLF